jgi:hypothetical protein
MTTCPRRMQEWGPWEKAENLDHWRKDKTCSFCGSLNPDIFLDLLAKGRVAVTPTDKNYKAYVEGLGVFRKFYFQHFDFEQQDKFLEIYNTDPRPFRMSDPGYFYVLPFFAHRREVGHE